MHEFDFVVFFISLDLREGSGGREPPSRTNSPWFRSSLVSEKEFITWSCAVLIRGIFLWFLFEGVNINRRPKTNMFV